MTPWEGHRPLRERAWFPPNHLAQTPDIWLTFQTQTWESSGYGLNPSLPRSPCLLLCKRTQSGANGLPALISFCGLISAYNPVDRTWRNSKQFTIIGRTWSGSSSLGLCSPEKGTGHTPGCIDGQGAHLCVGIGMYLS